MSEHGGQLKAEAENAASFTPRIDAENDQGQADENRAVQLEDINQEAANGTGAQADQNQQGANVMPKQEGRDQVIQVLVTTGLENYLKSKSDGKIILKSYQDSLLKKEPLLYTTRSKLVRVVIGREKDYLLRNYTPDQCLDNFLITSERFKLLANEIASIFQGENVATYYTEYVKTDDRSISPSGKLYHHYNYLKSYLRNKNVLRKKSVEKTLNVLSDTDIESVNNDVDIIWLSNHLEPKEELLDKWKLTFNVRTALLKQIRLSVSDYIDKFACLKIQVAKELFTIDFNFLYPDTQFVKIDKWKKSKLLISRLNRSCTKFQNDIILIELLKSRDLSEEKEDFLILYLLCYLVKPKRPGKRKRKDKDTPPRQLSVQERRESFILRIEAANEVEGKLRDLKERYMQNHETFQPFIVAVGEATRIQHYYVAVNENLFSVNKALEAIKLAFEVFFSFDCKYPNNSKTIWVFLQKILLNIDLPFVEVRIDINILIGEIQNL